MKFLALDFEGSHKNPRQGCPVQLGVAVMDITGEVLNSAEWIIRPPTHYKSGRAMAEVDAYALRVSGLSLEDIEDGMDSNTVCCMLQEFVQGMDAESLPVVAYNISYDYESYTSLLWNGSTFDYDDRERYAFPAILGSNWICAWHLAKRTFPGIKQSSLDDVAGRFGLARTTEKHGALEDAILAGKVFARLTTGVK